MEFVLNNEREQFPLTHHDLRVARLKRDKEMKAKAMEDEKKLELTFKPQINQDYQLKNNDGDFLQRLEKYEQNRKLKMAELHKEEFIRLQKETEKVNLLSPRSHHILNNKKKKDEMLKSNNRNTNNSNNDDDDDDSLTPTKRIRDQNFVDTNRIDWKTGDELFQPKINKKSKDLIGKEPSDRYGTGSTSNNVGEMLYRNAFNRKLRKVLAQRRLDEYNEYVRNKSKASKRTMTIMKKALARDIEVAFHATTGLRDEPSWNDSNSNSRNTSPIVSNIKKKSSNSSNSNSNNNNNNNNTNKNKKTTTSAFASPFDEDDSSKNLDVNILYEAEELLHTMYILNFLPSFALHIVLSSDDDEEDDDEGENNDKNSRIQSIKDIKDNDFINRCWEALAMKSQNSSSFIELSQLKRFLINAIYPGNNNNNNNSKDTKKEQKTIPPTVNVDLSLDPDIDDDGGENDNNNNNKNKSNVLSKEEQFLLQNNMLREVRYLYKKIMPSGYRSLESRQKKEKYLNPSPTTSPTGNNKNRRRGNNIPSKENKGRKSEHIHSLDAKELKECTFKPKINKYKGKSVAINQDLIDNGRATNGNIATTNSTVVGSNRREDILLAKYQLTKGKQALARKNQRAFEVKECTFQPDLSLSKKSLQYLTKSEKKKKRSKQKKKLVEEIPLTTEEREFRLHCTFTPKFVSKSISTRYHTSKTPNNKNKSKTSTNNIYGGHDGWLVKTSPDKNHHTPRAYEQAISRMRQARAKRVETKHLEDVHSRLRSGHRTSPTKDLPDNHRDARGRLRAKPFSFSTEARHEHRAHQKALKRLGYRGSNGRLLQYSRGTDPFTNMV